MKNGKPYKILDVLEHLNMVSQEVLDHFQMDHPRNFILEALPVPPPTVRPAIMLGQELVRSEDDLTYRLLQIIRHNNRLKKVRTQNLKSHVEEEARVMLQLSVSAYIDHKKNQSSASKDTGKEYTSLAQRLKSKEGRVRGNLMGKRCDYTARSVITGDDTLSMTEVGVPKLIAQTLTVSVRVTAFNKKALNKKLKDPKGGIQFVINPQGHRRDLNFANRNGFDLVEGWVVERHIEDGDIVLFNRQPTLHVGSLMAHTVKIMEGLTLRMNLSCTPPYNADCK